MHAALDFQKKREREGEEANRPRPHDLGTRRMTIHQPTAAYVTLQGRKGTAYKSVGETQGCHLTNTWHRDLSSGQPYPRPRNSAKPEPGRPAPGWRCTPNLAGHAPRWPCTPHPAGHAPRSLNAAHLLESHSALEPEWPAVSHCARRSRGSRSGSGWGSGRGGAPWTPGRARCLAGGVHVCRRPDSPLRPRGLKARGTPPARRQQTGQFPFFAFQLYVSPATGDFRRGTFRRVT